MPAQTILNADDYVPGRHARTKFLMHAGFDVTEAATGAETLRLAVEKLPKVIVLDVNLPDISGIEVCRRIKADPATAGIIVMHLSATSILADDQVSGLESGADTYLTEPVEPAVLVATIKAFLRARAAEDALRRSNQELQHFAHMIAHELNEPLRTVTTFTQLLAKSYGDKLDSDAHAYIEHACSAAERMHSFVQNVLTFSTATSPERDYAPVSCDAAITAALWECQTEIQEAGGTITYDPLPMVLGNELRLTMVFKNLIANALKYRRDAPPRIHISAVRNGDEWLFSIADNGIGIDPRYESRIFGMFKRLHGHEYPGSGIGLALCKRVIENHGGHIWVESQLGHGSTFYFTLPLLPPSAAIRPS